MNKGEQASVFARRWQVDREYAQSCRGLIETARRRGGSDEMEWIRAPVRFSAR
jgi:hypothetical protein